MASEPQAEKATSTATATKIKLEPPEALQPITVQEASGLVPLKSDETSELDQKVAKFVDELAALDSNSPEFGKKVDQLTAMGRKEIAEAAGASNRFLDRPVKAIDSDTGIGADLTELRRTVEELDPKENSKSLTGRKFLGIIPFGRRINNYFDKYRSSQTHISAILLRLTNGKDELLMDNAAIDTERAGLWKTMHRLEQMVHISKSLDKQLEDKANELDATEPAKAKAIRETALILYAPADDRPADTDGGHRSGLSGAGPGQEEQCRTGEGRRPRLDDDRFGASNGSDRCPGDEQPEACSGTGQRAQHNHGQHDRHDRRVASHADRRNP